MKNYLSLSKGKSVRAIKYMFKDCKNLKFYLRDDVTCYQKVGCIGFIQNTDNGKIVYITTELVNGLAMYRTVESLTDFHGGPNQWCKESEYKQKILELLK